MTNDGECGNCGEGILMEGYFYSDNEEVRIAGYLCDNKSCQIFYDKERYDSGEKQ